MARSNPGRSGVDGDAGDLGSADAAADTVPAFDDGGVIPLTGELVRRREPGESGANDDDVD